MKTSNWILRNGRGRIGLSSGKVPTYELSSLSAREKNRGPIKTRCIDDLNYLVSKFTWSIIIGSLLNLLIVGCIFVSLIGSAAACELEPHGFFRIGAGWTGSFDGGSDFDRGSDELAAQFDAGIRWPFTIHHSVDFRIVHHSFWFEGKPFNGNGEPTSDHINIGYEFRW